MNSKRPYSPSLDPVVVEEERRYWDAKKQSESAAVRSLMESAIKRVKELAKDRARVRKYNPDTKRAYYKANRDRILDDRKHHYNDHRDEVRARQAVYREGPLYALLDKQKTLDKQSEYVRNRRRNDPVFNIAGKTRCRIRHALRSAFTNKSSRTIDTLGCSFKELSLHLENQLDEGEELDDMEIDHIFPVSAYDLTQPEQQLAAFGYLNTQPLTQCENRGKSSKMPTRAMAAKVPAEQWPPGVTAAMLPSIYPEWKTALRKD